MMRDKLVRCAFLIALPIHVQQASAQVSSDAAPNIELPNVDTRVIVLDCDEQWFVRSPMKIIGKPVCVEIPIASLAKVQTAYVEDLQTRDWKLCRSEEDALFFKKNEVRLMLAGTIDNGKSSEKWSDRDFGLIVIAYLDKAGDPCPN